MSTIPYLLLSVILAVVAQILVKLGINSIDNLDLSLSLNLFKNYFRLFLNINFTIGLMCYIIATLVWLYSLTKVELSFATPFLALTYILILLGSWLILGDDISIYRIIGTLFVCLGLIIISLETKFLI
jgi:uncharacterized membrane protein